MDIFLVFRLGMKSASWVTPHVKEWHRRRQLNRTEGQRHLEAKNWLEAEKHLTAALGEHHPAKQKVEVLAQLARALASQGKLDEAAQTAEEAAEAAAKSRNPEVEWETLEALADIQLSQGKAEDAIQTMDRAEQQEMKRRRSDKAKLALSMRRRGKMLLKSGRSEEAFKALEGSLKMTEMIWGAQHTEMANALTEIGSFYREIGNQAEAQQFLQRAIGIYRVTEAFDSTQAAEGLHHLAISLEESGDVEGAVHQYERFLSLSERQIGGNRRAVAAAQVHLGELYLRNGSSSMAREVLVQAVHGLELLRDERLVEAVELMAIAEDESGRPREAARWRERAAKLSARVIAPIV